MLTQLKSFDEMVGKTVAAVDIGSADDSYIVFTDGTFMRIQKYSWPEGGGGIEAGNVVDLHGHMFNAALLVRLGIATQPEIDRAKRENKKMAEDARHQNDLRELARLKAMYPDERTTHPNCSCLDAEVE